MMTKRLATTILAASMLTAVVTPTGHADDTEYSKATLKGLTNITVSPVLSDGAKKLGLTEEMIQTDVELKLRLAGLHVLTNQESLKVRDLGMLSVRVITTDPPIVEYIEVELKQNARLMRNGELAGLVQTWSTGTVAANMSVQRIRDKIKDQVAIFLNAFLFVNSTLGQ